MVFSSADYPVFLIAVFFLYNLVGAGPRRGPITELARLTLACALGDLIYLLLCKNPHRLWDPFGTSLAAAFGALPWRDLARPDHLVRYVVGVLTLMGSLTLGQRYATQIDDDRTQNVIAKTVSLALVVVGVTVLVGSLAHRLDAISEQIARVAHLGYVALLGTALGASRAVTPERGEDGRPTAKLLVLFAASMVFYHAWAATMAGAYRYLLALILGTIALDYWLGLWIADTPRPHTAVRRALVVLSLVANLGVLGLFKYYDFFVKNAARAFELGGYSFPLHPVALILPAGISFHTFQSLSYTLDVHARGLKPTRSILRFATFVLFFPQLVAGPIVRAETFLPQLTPRSRPGLAGLGDALAAPGLLRIAVGLAKKVCVADVLAVTLVDRVFEHPGRYSGLECLAAVYGYALQIYFDFSAYSDIAIGSAALLGFELPENFARPYGARSLQDFWHRWHITLSTWLRDYLYIPLGGSRGSEAATHRNLLVTMLLGGLWHGAGWTFIAWGALHGLGLAVTRAFQRSESSARLHAWLRARPLWNLSADALSLALTFHYVCFAWVFFRASDFAHARALLTQLATATTDAVNVQKPFVWALVAGFASQLIPGRAWELARTRFTSLSPVGRAALLVVAALAIRHAARPWVVPFIYFQF